MNLLPARVVARLSIVRTRRARDLLVAVALLASVATVEAIAQTDLGVGTSVIKDTPSRVLMAFGLTGTWSTACDEPTSARNARYTYVYLASGGVESVGDFGQDGPSRTTVLKALIAPDHTLHTVTYTTFDNLPKSLREALAKNGTHPNVTRRTTLVRGPNHSVRVEDSDAEFENEGVTVLSKVVSGGVVVNPTTQQADGPKVRPAFRCSE